MKYSGIPRSQKGYTLIELLLYVSIVGTLLTTIVLFFGVATDARLKNQAISEVNQQGQFAMDVITAALRDADGITTPAAAASGASATVTNSVAALNPTIINLSGTSLQIKEGAAAAVALTGSKVEVSNLTFRNLTRAGTPGSIQVSFTLARANDTGRAGLDYQQTFTTTVSIR